MKPDQPSRSTLARWRRRFERRRKSPWHSPGHGRVTPKVLPVRFGDGRQFAMLSFYASPETCVVVAFDSALPLELPDDERFKPYTGVRSFRDVLDQVYELCQRHVRLPRHREREAQMEQDEDDELTPWEVVIERGSTWCWA